MHDTEGLRRDENRGQTHCLRLYKKWYDSSKLNLESDCLIVHIIYESHRAKGISYIVIGRRGWA